MDKFFCRAIVLTVMLVDLLILMWIPVGIIYGLVRFVIIDGITLEEYWDIYLDGSFETIKKIYSTLWRSFVDGEWHSLGMNV